MDPIKEFKLEVQDNIEKLSKASEFHKMTHDWVKVAGDYRYSYNFSWMGRPAIQLPTDAWAMQEIIWQTKPDLIIECGVAHGGSIIYYASLLAMLDLTEALEKGTVLDPKACHRRVLGIDIDIRKHNRKEIEEHPFFNWIELKEGSSIDPDIVSWVKKFSADYQNILLILDSNHTHDHVLEELHAYANLVAVGNYCIVFDTIIEDMPAETYNDRPWGPGNNPKTAVWEFLKTNRDFQINDDIPSKLQITVGPDGFLKRIS